MYSSDTLFACRPRRVPFLDDGDIRPKRDFDGKIAEARFMEEILPQTMSSFTTTYAGHHFQNLPAELLQAIAIQCSIPAKIWPDGNRVSPRLGRFRLLCRETCEAGKAALIIISRRRRFLSPRKIFLPSRKLSIDDMMKVFKGTGLGQVVKEIDIHLMPVITHKEGREMLIEYFEAHGKSEEDALVAADTVLQEQGKAICSQGNFFNSLRSASGFRKICQLLDHLPNVQALEIRMIDFFWTVRHSELMEDLCHDDDPSRKVLHWNAMPQILELAERYAIKRLSIEADSSMFGETLGSSQPRRRATRNFPILSDTLISSKCHHLTHIQLSMTRYDYKCTGRYHETQFGLQNSIGFHKFLASTANLTDLHIENSRSDHPGSTIDAEWLDLVLGGQVWPKLKHFHLNAAHVFLTTLIGLLGMHKETLSAVSICNVAMANPGKTVALINYMRDNLATLKRCEMTGHDYYDGTLQGANELAKLGRMYGPYGHLQSESDSGGDDDDDESDSELEDSDEGEDLSDDDSEGSGSSGGDDSSSDSDTGSYMDGSMPLEAINFGLLVMRQDTSSQWSEEGRPIGVPEEGNNSEDDW